MLQNVGDSHVGVKTDVRHDDDVCGSGLYQRDRSGHVFVHLSSNGEGWVDQAKLLPKTSGGSSDACDLSGPTWLGAQPKDVLHQLLHGIVTAIQGTQPADLEPWLPEHTRTTPLMLATPSMGEADRDVWPPHEVRYRVRQLHELSRMPYDNRGREEWASLWKEGLPPNARVRGHTLMHRACAQGYLSLVDDLYSRGADAQSLGQDDHAVPIETACFLGRTDVVGFLLQQGACIGRGLHLAASAGNTAVVRLVLEALYAPLNLRVGTVSILESAIEGDSDSVVELLLHTSAMRGVSLDVECGKVIREKHGLDENATVLHLAAKLGRHKIVIYMREALPNWEDLKLFADCSGQFAIDVAL